MTSISGSHSTTIAAEASTVFDAITNPARLPAWNARMTSVIDAPTTLGEVPASLDALVQLVASVPASSTGRP